MRVGNNDGILVGLSEGSLEGWRVGSVDGQRVSVPVGLEDGLGVEVSLWHAHFLVSLSLRSSQFP